MNYFLRKAYNGEYELSDTSLFPIIKPHSATYRRFIGAKEGSDKGQRKRNTGEERALHYQGTANLDKVRHRHFVKEVGYVSLKLALGSFNLAST